LTDEAQTGRHPIQPLSDGAAGSGRSTVQFACLGVRVHDGLGGYGMNETLQDEGCRVPDTQGTSSILVLLRDTEPRCG
jgi:hypothetical protein